LIEKAQNLLGKLKDEKSRWGQQLEEIARQYRSLPIDTLLSAAFTNYLSGVDEG